MKDVSLLTSNGIDVNHGLDLLGDMEMYDETLQDFLDESEETIMICLIMQYKYML